MLATILKIEVNVYKHHDLSSFQYKETFETYSFPYSHSILYEGNGHWKRLEPNYNLNALCRKFIPKADEQIYNPTYFTQLKTWIAENKEIDKDFVITAIEKFENTSDKLNKLIFKRLNKLNKPSDVGQINQLASSICSLAEWVEFYNTRNVSSFFPLYIVENFEPQEWKYEFLLLEMEERLEKPLNKTNERENWRNDVLGKLKIHDQASLLLTKIAMKKEESDIFFSLDLNKMLPMLKVLEEEKFNSTECDIGHSAITLFYKQRSIMWEEKIDEWNSGKTDKRLTDENKRKFVHLILELEYRNEKESLHNLTTQGEIEDILRSFVLLPGQSSKLEPKSLDTIISEMKRQNHESKYEKVMTKIENLVQESKTKKLEFKSDFENIVMTLINAKPEKYNKLKIFLKEEQSKEDTATSTLNKEKYKHMTKYFFEIILKKWNKMKNLDDEHVCNKIRKWIHDGIDLNDDSSLINFLCVFDYIVELIMRFQLRDTQRVAIMTLLLVDQKRLTDQRKTLAQVSTGEGKSVIVAGVAIGFALFNKRKKRKRKKTIRNLLDKKETGKRRHSKVDVITSNDVLALRDSNLSVTEGGLKELYEFFNVTVANNCSKYAENRTSAYNMDVVYGQLANFQRDFLLDEFYHRKIRGDRSMDFVIIDEADCMLLDRGNNVLYLSHDIPGMEMLESLYVFIWGKIRDTSPEVIKPAVLYDLYGQINEEDLNSIYAPLGQEELTERTAIWEHLIEKQIIDRQGRLLITNVNEITEDKINYLPINEALKEKQLNSKISFYFRIVAERERHIRIPSHLLPFVDRHLDTWLDNARRALKLKQDEDYVIDCDRSDTSPDLNPQVIIIDPDTGTDQSSSQWDGALHQFLQLKEGCKLTMQSLKSIFISNANYMIQYNDIAGVSGTLGCESEQEFLKNKYKCLLYSIPTAYPKCFRLKPSKLLKTKESWRSAIIEETRLTIVDDNRSIVIFCRSIKEVNQVHKHLKCAISVLRNNNKRIHRYTREYEKFEFEKEPGLDVGNVIVATNLAGRGTDIKLSKTLKENGGLHVCLTYFPENERVEDQVMGRAARKGEPGSGILILCELPTGHQGEEFGETEEWGVEKMFVMKEDRAWKERQRISRLEKDFKRIALQETKLDFFTRDFAKEKDEREFSKEERKERNIQQVSDDRVLIKAIQDNALDNWALWLDEVEHDFNCFEIEEPITFELKMPVIKSLNDILNWLSPARTISCAKYLVMKKLSRKIEIFEIIENKMSDINLNDGFLCAAFLYFRAFILLAKIKNENKNFENEKTELIRTLRNTETILNEHIDMQISFSLIHNSERKLEKTSSFCDVHSYTEQKENNINILQYFLESTQWLLGSHCSISDLRKAGGETPKVPGFVAKTLKKTENFIENKKITRIEELKTRKICLEKVDKYFRQLFNSKCIDCKLNEPDTIPNVRVGVEKLKISSNKSRSKIILQTADDYGVRASLEDKLKLVFEKPRNEVDIEKKLKENIQISCTRKAFWKKLVDAEALNPLKECTKMDCFIIAEEQLEELQSKLDRKNAITLDFGETSFDGINNSLNVLYSPTYDSKQELEAAKKLMFSKEYIKRILLSEYRESKKKFESNKIALLDLGKLKDVNLDSFGQLGMDDLRRIKIDLSEHEGIWNQLVEQKIINSHGYIVPDNDLTKEFNYRDCPVYADTVMRLVRQKFVVELVRQQWLMFKDNANCLKAINLLPRKPYRDMLADLMAAHVISGARVTEDFAIDRLKEEVNKITEYDDERDCLMEFLKSRQPAYAAKEITPEYFLDFMEGYIKSTNFAGELYVFRLVGFDCFIDIEDRKWTFKRKCLASLFTPFIITGGLVTMGVGTAALIPKIQELVGFKLPFGFCKNLFFMGVSDILYAVETILSRKDFTWADYGRQKIRSAIGKMDPIDAIKAIWKLSKSSNQSFRDMTFTNEHRWNTTRDRSKDEVVGIQNFRPE